MPEHRIAPLADVFADGGSNRTEQNRPSEDECGFCVGGVAEVRLLGTTWIEECQYCHGTGFVQEVGSNG